MDRSISIPPRAPGQLTASSSASSFGSMDSSASSPYPILCAPPIKQTKSPTGSLPSQDIIIARPRPRRRLSSVYSTESNHSGSSEVSSSTSSSSQCEEEPPKWGSLCGGDDKYSVFKSMRRADASYKGWSKEVLGLGPYGWSEEILEGGYESADSAFSNGSEDSLPRGPNNPFLLSTPPSPPSVYRNNLP